MLVAVTVDGKDAPWSRERDPQAREQGQITARAVRNALEELGHRVALVEADSNLLLSLRALHPDLIFNLATGGATKRFQAHIVAMLELSGVPFTGSSLESHLLALNKPLAKMVFRQRGLPTPPYVVLTSPGEPLPAGLRFPLLVKPSREGSGAGIGPESVVRDEAALSARVAGILAEYEQEALVEEFLPGREFTVAVIGNQDPLILAQEIVLPPEEREIGGPLYGYLLKRRDRVRRLNPPPLSPAQRARLEDISLGAFRALGCRDCARVDIRMDEEEEMFVLEVNTLPGLQPDYSELPHLAAGAGLSYTALIDRLVKEAWARLGRGTPLSR